MANFQISSTPAYSGILRMLEATDPAHADIFNPMFLRLLENDAYLKENYLPISKLANNLVTTSAGYGLDARQGAVLNNKINQLNTDLGNLQSGKVDLIVGGNNSITYTVKFPKPYISSPTFVASAGHASKASLYVSVHSLTGIGGKITVYNLTSSEGTFTINWIAFPVT